MSTNTMDKWTSKQTFEEWLETTVPTGQYDDSVIQILQEESCGGRFEWLKGNHTIFDLELARHQRMLSEFETNLIAKKQSIATLQQKYREEQENKKPSGKILNQYKTSLDSMYAERFEIEADIQKTKPMIEALDQTVYSYKAYYVALRKVVALYKERKDKEFLRKGIHAICAYRDYLKGTNEEVVRRTLLIEEYGDVPELRQLFDLERIPLKVFYALGDLVKHARKQSDKKYLMEALLYYKENHPHEFLPEPVQPSRNTLHVVEEFQGSAEKPETTNVKDEEIEDWADEAAGADADLYRKFDRD